MADGVTIQRSSQGAIEKGVSLRWILDQLAAKTQSSTPILLMSYLNPLLAFGYETLAARYRAQTGESLDAAVRAAIDPDRFVWVVVGDASVVRPQLDSLGLDIEVREMGQ
mgnify:CR=1 FL=1